MYAMRDARTHLVDLVGHDGHGAQAWVADGQHLGRHLQPRVYMYMDQEGGYGSRWMSTEVGRIAGMRVCE